MRDTDMHILRNPWGHGPDRVRAAQINAAAEIDRLRAALAASEANLAALQARWDARPVAGFTDVYGNSLGVSDTCTDCGCTRGQHEHGTGLCGVAGCACDGYVPYEGRT